MLIDNQQKNKTVLIWKDADSLSIAAAHYFVTECNRRVTKTGKFTVALSGGSTPKKLYELLASPEFSRNIPWKKVFLFWSDERFVDNTSPESNYRMVKESLLDHIPIPQKNIFPIPTVGTPGKCAREYENTILDFFNKKQPRFDLLLLGAGTDGHTASIFPRTAILKEKRLIKEMKQPATNADRISFTLPLINHARQIVFLASGVEKARVIATAFSKKKLEPLLPVQLVEPTRGNLAWMLDEEAGSLLLKKEKHL